MKNKKATAKFDGDLQRSFRELDPDRQDQARYYLKIRLAELHEEMREELNSRKFQYVSCDMMTSSRLGGHDMNEENRKEKKIDCIVAMLRRMPEQDVDLIYRLTAKLG